MGLMNWLSAAEDLIFYTVRGCLLVYLIKDFVPVRDRFVKYQVWVLKGVAVQYIVFDMAISYWQWFRNLFYGGVNVAMDSRVSTVPHLIGMLLTILFCLYFFGGRKSVVLYLITAFYTLKELVMFMLHSLFSTIFKGVISLEMYVALNGNVRVLENFQTIVEITQSIWNLLFYVVSITALLFAVIYLKKNLYYEGRALTRVQQLFLVIPCIMGLCFGVLMRSILYETRDVQVELLIDNFPETGLLIPAISALCLLSIILSAVILKKLLESNEKEILVGIYQSRISDMEEHMKDVEHLYDGIRGMRHDMKNCVADLELLIHNPQNQNSEVYQKEMRSYLDELYNAMEGLEMKCSTGNPVTDVVISRKLRSAEEKNISFDCDFLYPEGMGISAFDISIILNNGLDNAIEAAEKEKAPHVGLDSYVRGNMFFLEIRNSFTGALNPDETGKNLLSVKKEEGHGLGMKNIKSCAARYFGRVDWTVKDGEFVLTVMLQGKR